MNKHKYKLTISQTRKLLALPLLITSGVCGCNSNKDAGRNADAAKAAQTKSNSIDRVSAGPPVKKTLRLFTEQPGSVHAFAETPILSKLAGYVESVHFDIGDKVTKGQTLVTIHAPEYNDQLQQKLGQHAAVESQVKQAEAALVAAEAIANSSQALITVAEASIGRTDAEVARWNSENQRIEQLVAKGSVTPKLAEETSSKLQAATAAKKEALANIEAVKAKLRESQANVLTAKADIDAAKAKLNVAQSEIAQAKTMLTYTQLVAPFDGVVTSRQVDAGHYVQPAGANNAEPLMTIANVNQVRIFVNVPESEAAWVDAGFADPTAGDPVTIISPSIQGAGVESRVTRTGLQLDSQSRSLSVEIDVANIDLRILPGAYVTTKILLEQRENVWTLPVAAIVKTADGVKCCVVVDGKIQHRPIELGLRVGDEVEIKSGLDGQETVVLARANSLQAGQGVEVIVKK